MAHTVFGKTVTLAAMTTTEPPPSLSQADTLPFQLAAWIWLLWPPFTVVMGTLGNVTSLMVLRGMGGGGSTVSMYLSVLALSDLTVLYTGVLRYWLLEVFGYEAYWHSVLCKLGMWVYGAAWNNSTYLLVAVTAQRAVSVVWPHRVRVMCTRTTTWAVIGGIAVTSALLLSHVPYGYDVVYDVNSTDGRCGHGSYSYSSFNAEVWVFVEIVTFALFPFLCLLVCNAVLVHRMGASVQAASHSLATGPSDHVSQRRKKASSTTVTVMVMSLVFVIFNLPMFVHLIVYSTHNFDATEQFDVDFSGMEYFVQSFVALLVFGNFAINFYLYCLTGTRFRNEFKKLVYGRCTKGPSVDQKTLARKVHSVDTEETQDDF